MQPIRLFLLSRYNKKRKSDFFSHYRTKRVNVCEALKNDLMCFLCFHASDKDTKHRFLLLLGL